MSEGSLWHRGSTPWESRKQPDSDGVEVSGGWGVSPLYQIKSPEETGVPATSGLRHCSLPLRFVPLSQRIKTLS